MLPDAKALTPKRVLSTKCFALFNRPIQEHRQKGGVPHRDALKRILVASNRLTTAALNASGVEVSAGPGLSAKSVHKPTHWTT